MPIKIFGRKYRFLKALITSMLSTLIIAIIVFEKELSWTLVSKVLIAGIVVFTVSYFINKEVQ